MFCVPADGEDRARRVSLLEALSMEYALPRLRGRWAALGSLNRASRLG